MGYRKFAADGLFTGTKMLDQNYVLITQSDGEVIDIVNKENAGEGVETFAGIISPGFINAHCHLELSHMKGLIPEKTGLVDFVYKVVAQRHFPAGEISGAIAKAEGEMLSTGIIAVGDICNNTSTIEQKKLQRIQYYNFIEASGWLPSVSQARFDRSLGFYELFSHELIGSRQSIVPHAPYSVSEELWQLIVPFFEDKTVTIHNQESAFEDEFFLEGTGDFARMYKLMNMDTSFYKPHKKTSIQSYFEKLSGADSVLLVHNTFTGKADIEFVKSESSHQLVSYCICINANLYIENALPPIEMLMQEDCNIVLGTDSLASNHSLNLLDEMKTIQQHFSSITLTEMLQWATLNGAKALDMNYLGSFEKGKKPGVVLIENVENNRLTNHSTSKRLI